MIVELKSSSVIERPVGLDGLERFERKVGLEGLVLIWLREKIFSVGLWKKSWPCLIKVEMKGLDSPR